MRVFLFACMVTLLASCRWDNEDKDTFRQACMDDAKGWMKDDAKAKTYCECVLTKMMARYPDENDALDHIGELAKDTSLMNCRNVVKP